MKFCLHRSEELSEASGTLCPISSTSSSCSCSVCWYSPLWPWSFLGIGEHTVLAVSACEFSPVWFSPLVAESVTGCHLPRSDTPGVLLKGGKKCIRNHSFIYGCEFLTLCFWFLFRGLQTVEGLPYFTNILEIAFELYVLVTTANSPDVMYVHLCSRSWTPVTTTEFTLLKTLPPDTSRAERGEVVIFCLFIFIVNIFEECKMFTLMIAYPLSLFKTKFRWFFFFFLNWKQQETSLEIQLLNIGAYFVFQDFFESWI